MRRRAQIDFGKSVYLTMVGRLLAVTIRNANLWPTQQKAEVDGPRFELAEQDFCLVSSGNRVGD